VFSLRLILCNGCYLMYLHGLTPLFFSLIIAPTMESFPSIFSYLCRYVLFRLLCWYLQLPAPQEPKQLLLLSPGCNSCPVSLFTPFITPAFLQALCRLPFSIVPQHVCTGSQYGLNYNAGSSGNRKQRNKLRLHIGGKPGYGRVLIMSIAFACWT